MILIRILGKDETQLKDIAKILLKEKLAVDVNLKKGVERLEMKDGKIDSAMIYLMTLKTKGLLFPVIEKLINERYDKNPPEVYSLPIVNMDWEQSRQLRNDVTQV